MFCLLVAMGMQSGSDGKSRFVHSLAKCLQMITGCCFLSLSMKFFEGLSELYKGRTTQPYRRLLQVTGVTGLASKTQFLPVRYYSEQNGWQRRWKGKAIEES